MFISPACAVFTLFHEKKLQWSQFHHHNISPNQKGIKSTLRTQQWHHLLKKRENWHLSVSFIVRSDIICQSYFEQTKENFKMHLLSPAPLPRGGEPIVPLHIGPLCATCKELVTPASRRVSLAATPPRLHDILLILLRLQILICKPQKDGWSPQNMKGWFYEQQGGSFKCVWTSWTLPTHKILHLGCFH